MNYVLRRGDPLTGAILRKTFCETTARKGYEESKQKYPLDTITLSVGKVPILIHEPNYPVTESQRQWLLTQVGGFLTWLERTDFRGVSEIVETDKETGLSRLDWNPEFSMLFELPNQTVDKGIAKTKGV